MTSLALALFLAATPTNDLETALARPLSPGAVALLLEHSQDARARERIAAGLAAESAPTRAAAARVANAGALVGLGPRVAEVLAKEVDPDAALEEARALLGFDRRFDETVMSAARRLGGTAAGSLGLALAAARGGAAILRLDALRAAGFPARLVARFLENVGHKDPAALSVVGTRALRDGDEQAWREVLDVARRLKAEVDPGLLAVGLGSDVARAATLEHLSLTLPRGGARPAPLAAALESLRAATPAAQRSLAFHLVDRLDGNGGPDLKGLVEAADGGDASFLPVAYGHGETRGLMTPPEREAAQKRLGWPKGQAEAAFLLAWEGLPRGGTLMRLAGGYPAAFVQDLLAASGCAVDGKHMLGGRFRRDSQGRPVETAVFKDLAGSPACIVAGYALAATHLNEVTDAPTAFEREIVLLPLDRDVLECSTSPTTDTSSEGAEQRLRRAGTGRIEEPRKVHNVAPTYPDSAKSQGISGVVILDAEITTKGCVHAIRVLRSAHPLLDVEALRAVAAWRYRPPLLDGVPVPVIMSVTVNFKLG